jgi:pyruvate,water dikinase
MLTLTMVMGGPISFLRYMKTLNYHSANHTTPGTRILKDLDSLFTLIKIKPQIKESIDNGKLPEDKEFLNLWTIYLKNHGHRGIYESDLSQPRFRENHEYILKLLSIGESSHKVKIKLSLTSILTLPIWWILKKFIYARENTRYEAMKAFESIREEWLALEVNLKSLNIIPEHASIWNLTLSELSVINSKNIYSDELYKKRTTEIQANKNHTLPDNLKRQTFLEPFLKTTTENLKKTFTGLGLTGGQVEGTAWVLKKPNLDLPRSFQKKTTILIAPAVDAGWIPTFSQVSGVAVDTGGDLSHGSIILRELGIPAITNAIGVFQNIKTGDKVSLIADEGVLLKR